MVGRGKFGGASKTAPHRVEPLPELAVGPVQQGPVRLPFLGGRFPAEQLRHPVAGLQKALAVSLPQPRRPLQQLQQPQVAGNAPFRQVGPGKKRLLLRRHQDGEGPAAGAGEGLAGLHIHRVHIGPLLPVHLDADEIPVQRIGHLFIRKGLPGHHMAPVAGGVADA